HDLGELGKRAPPADAIRRHEVVRHRPRWWRLFVRFLHGDEEHRDRARQSQDSKDWRLMLRDPVFNPPFNIVRASHVELGVADIARARAFYVDCLGYIVSDQDNDALYLRGVEERNHHSVVLRRSDAVVALAIGLKVGAAGAMD